MNSILCYTLLRRIELKNLATVECRNTISELATKFNYSESYLSRGIGDPLEKELIFLKRLRDRSLVGTDDGPRLTTDYNR